MSALMPQDSDIVKFLELDPDIHVDRGYQTIRVLQRYE